MKKKRRQSNALFIALVLTLFLVGLVMGMLIVHLNDEKRREELAAEYEEKIKALEKEAEELADDRMKVYVPDRKRVYGQIPLNAWAKKGTFRLDNGFMAYFDENGEKQSRLGVDLSYHQKSVNWEELKASQVEFVMLRCGFRGYSEGGLVADEKFREYAQKCNEYEIPLGVYFFTQALTVEEAEAEADFTLNLIKDYEISYPVAFDTEYVADPEARSNVEEISDELRTDIIVAFCEKIKEAGYYPMVYASESWIRRNMDFEKLQAYDFWAPQYLEENDFLFDFTIWQYTDSGNIPGIDTVVDLDISMVDYASFVPALRQAALDNAVLETYEAEEEQADISIVMNEGNGENEPAQSEQGERP